VPSETQGFGGRRVLAGAPARAGGCAPAPCAGWGASRCPAARCCPRSRGCGRWRRGWGAGRKLRTSSSGTRHAPPAGPPQPARARDAAGRLGRRPAASAARLSAARTTPVPEPAGHPKRHPTRCEREEAGTAHRRKGMVIFTCVQIYRQQDMGGGGEKRKGDGEYHRRRKVP
jgi:hypothetical protein